MAGRERGRARMVAGLANHRRIEIVRLLMRGRTLCVDEVAVECGIDQSTAVEHLRRLHEAGLIVKKSKGRRVLLSPTKRAKAFVKAIDTLWDLAE
ncbi:MAG: ArsR/SmtB family transcription factor [Chthoniobacterales bacterium]